MCAESRLWPRPPQGWALGRAGVSKVALVDNSVGWDGRKSLEPMPSAAFPLGEMVRPTWIGQGPYCTWVRSGALTRLPAASSSSDIASFPVSDRS